MSSKVIIEFFVGFLSGLRELDRSDINLNSLDLAWVESPGHLNLLATDTLRPSSWIVVSQPAFSFF